MPLQTFSLEAKDAVKDKTAVLLVEDNIALAQNLFEFLGERDYVLDFAQDGLTALHLIATHTFDVIVLDIMVPGVSGLEICRRLRQDMKSTTPIIFMTARDAIEDKIQGFTLGGDDWLVKPFHLQELALRIQALRRRGSAAVSILRAGTVSFNPGTLTLTVDGSGPNKQLTLADTAAHIFESLMRAWPNFVPYDSLYQRLWPDRHVDLDGNTLRTHVYLLRKQLQETFGAPLIKTLNRRGYILTPPEAGAEDDGGDAAEH